MTNIRLTIVALKNRISAFTKLFSAKITQNIISNLLTVLTVAIYVIVASSDEVCAETVRVPLYKLAPAKTMDLKCVSAEYSIKIPIPARWNVTKAVIMFDYVNSTGLLAGKSSMTLKMNRNPISQINLNPLAPEGSVKLVIAGANFKTGYNDLNFSVSQHYTMDCEQPCAADLWTTLKLDQAVMEIEYSLKPVPVKLSSINDYLFDPKISPGGSVNLVLENRNADLVTVATIVASGIAKRFDYKKVSFTTSSDIKPGFDNIIIGNKGFIESFLKTKMLPAPKITGPFLKVMHLPPAGIHNSAPTLDANHALIVVSGDTIDQLKLAAATLSIISYSFPNSDELIATELKLSGTPKIGGRLTVSDDKKYTFKNLYFETITLRGFKSSTKDIMFRLPADVLIKPNLYVDLTLNYAYGAALGPGSVINILLNGLHVKAIHLDNTKGDLIEGYKLRIPSYLFKPGENNVRFEAAMIPLNNKACENMQLENLFLTIFENSTIHFPKLPTFAELPSLEMLMLDGFPVTRLPDGKGLLLYLTRKDTNTINAALNIAGMISQKSGYPLFETTATYTDPKKFNGELIIVGDLPSIPEKYWANAPLKLSGASTVLYRFSHSLDDETSVAESSQISTLKPGKAALMEFMSPFSEGRTVVMVTAANPHELEIMSDILTESSVQSRCTGDIALVDLESPEYTVDSLSVGKKYISGRSGNISVIKRYLYYYPYLYYLAIVLLFIAMTFLIFHLLKKHRKRRLNCASVSDR